MSSVKKGKNGTVKVVRSRTFELVLYPDDFRTLTVMSKLAEEYENFVGILHDKDVDGIGQLKKPHYHILLTYENPRTLTSVTKRLGVSENAVEAKDNVKQSMLYLCHRTAKSRHKWQYDTAELFGPDAQRAADLIADSDRREQPESARAAAILDIIMQKDGPRTVTQLVTMVIDRGLWDVYRRAAYTWGKILEEAQAAERPTYMPEGWSSISAAEIAGKAMSDAPGDAQPRKPQYAEYPPELVELAVELAASDARSARGERDPLRFAILRKVELAGGRSVLPPIEFL